MESINGCFIKGLRENPNLSGDVDIRVTVNGEGRVLDAGVEKSTFLDNKVPLCIVNLIKGFSFPKNSQNKTFSATIPLRFRVERKTEKKKK